LSFAKPLYLTKINDLAVRSVIYGVKFATEKNRHVGEATVLKVLMPGVKRFTISKKCFDLHFDRQ